MKIACNYLNFQSLENVSNNERAKTPTHSCVLAFHQTSTSAINFNIVFGPVDHCLERFFFYSFFETCLNTDQKEAGKNST